MASSQFPGFFDLLKESWNLLRSKFKPFILLSLAEVAIISLAAAILGVIAMLTSLSRLVNISFDNITVSDVLPMIKESLPQITIISLVFIILVGIISAIFSAAKIYALTVDKPFGDLLHFGKSRIYRIFASQLIIALLSFGGFWLFSFPGMLFLYLTSFTIYELVLTDLSVTKALKSSIAIIWHNFWSILGRYLLVFIIVAIIRSLFSPSGDQSQGISSLSWIVNTISDWFVLVYSFLLYKSAKAHTPASTKVNLAWIIVPAIIGWITFYTLFYFGTKFLQSRGVFDDFGGKIEQLIKDNEGIDFEQELKNLETTT